MPLFYTLGQLTVNTHICGGVVALLQQSNEMCFDRGIDFFSVCSISNVIYARLYCMEYALQSEFEDFVQYRCFRIKVVINAAGFHSSLVGNLSKRRCGITLLPKKLSCDSKDKFARNLRFWRRGQCDVFKTGFALRNPPCF